MTNRQYFETLTDEEFADLFLVEFNEEENKWRTPTLYGEDLIRDRETAIFLCVEWLKKEKKK